MDVFVSIGLVYCAGTVFAIWYFDLEKSAVSWFIFISTMLLYAGIAMAADAVYDSLNEQRTKID
jgi:hypothetical protein